MSTVALGEVEIFRDLNQSELSAVASLITRSQLAARETVFEEGDTGLELYVVAEGALEAVVKTDDGADFPVAQFGPGDFFGEMSIFEDAPRSATCRSREQSTVLSLSKSDFFTIVADRPGTAIKVMDAMLRVITRRLQTTSSLVAGMVQWGEEARKRVAVDSATGLFNRGFLDSALPGLFARAVTAGQSLSLVMLDLDHFREINEANGHDAGDRVIEAVAPIIAQVYGREDAVLARYGGDEFTLALPGIDEAEAVQLAEQTRRAVESVLVSIPSGEDLAVTVSQGVASFPKYARNLETLIEAADQALYSAKEAGRNRVATPPTTVEDAE